MSQRRRGKRQKAPGDALNTRLEKLRSILYAGPTRNTWHELGEFFDAWPEDETLAMGLHYAQVHLADWPDELCSNRGRAWQWVVSVLEGARNPRASLVRQAHFRDKNLGGVEPLASSADVSALRVLDGVRMGPSGLKKLLSGQPWPALESLDLSGNWLQNKDIEALAEIAVFPRLERLRLSDNRVTAAGVAQLLRSSHLLSLVELDLSNNPITTLRPLMDCKGLERLQGLDLSGCALEANLEGLLRSGHLTNLRRLGLGRTGLRQAEFLDQVLPRLRELRAERNPLGDLGLRQILEALDEPDLEVLDLSGCKLTDRAIARLVQSPLPDRLVELRLATNRVTNQGARALAERVWPRLTVLDVSCNELGDEGGRALAGAPMPSLRALSLAGNHLTPLGVVDVTLAEGLGDEARAHLIQSMVLPDVEGHQVEGAPLLRLLLSPRLSDGERSALVERLSPMEIGWLAREPVVGELLALERIPVSTRHAILGRMTIADLTRVASQRGTAARGRLRRQELIDVLVDDLFGGERG